jgi:hypothetical protein
MASPARYVVVAPRASEMAQWLQCNDIVPNEVPFKTDVLVELDTDGVWVIRHAVYARTSAGLIRRDAALRGYAYDWRSVPLLNDPPMWWLKEVSVPLVEGADAWLPGFNVD